MNPAFSAVPSAGRNSDPTRWMVQVPAALSATHHVFRERLNDGAATAGSSGASSAPVAKHEFVLDTSAEGSQRVVRFLSLAELSKQPVAVCEFSQRSTK